MDFPLGTAPHHRLRQSELDLSILGSEKMGRQQVELPKKGVDDFQPYWQNIMGIQSCFQSWIPRKENSMKQQ